MVSPDYDGTMNWLGNDRYRGYVKLYPGVEPDSLAEPMRAMQRKYQDFEALKKIVGFRHIDPPSPFGSGQLSGDPRRRTRRRPPKRRHPSPGRFWRI